MTKRATEPTRLSDVESLIEETVRARSPEAADRWYWGSAGSGEGARGANGRTLYAYWQTSLDAYEKLVPKMNEVRDAICSLDEVRDVRVRDYEPETAYSGEPIVGEQWEIYLDVDIAGPATAADR